MKFKRVTAVVLSVVMLVLLVPAVHATGSAVFSFSSSVPSGNEVAIGETVTYTVSLGSSTGFGFGTLFFAPSDNLEYVGATYKGSEVTAEKAATGENSGAYGIVIAGEPITGSDDKLCTIKFKVTGKGSISVRFIPYQLNDGSAFVTPSVSNGTITHTVNEFAVPQKPKILELESGSSYVIDGDYLRGVVEETVLSALLYSFKNSDRIKVFDASGKEVTSSDTDIGTGYTVSLMDGSTKVHTVTVVVIGDVNGNGRVDSNDYQRIRRYVFGNYAIEGAYFEAACVSGGSDVRPVDYQRVRRHVFGNYNIFE